MSQGGYLDDLPHHNSSALLASLQERAAARAQPTSSRSKHGRSSRRDRDLSDIDDSEYSGQRDDETESEDSWNTEDEEAEEARLAQEEWDEGIKQLQTAVQVMLLPFVGKWLGRKWSYWAFTRYQAHGLSAHFFGLAWFWAPDTIIPSSAVAAVQP